MSNIENSVVPSNKMEPNQNANPESGEGDKQPEDTRAEHVISIHDRFKESFIKLKDLYAPVKEEDEGSSVEEEDKGSDEGPLIGQVPVFLREKTEIEKYFQVSFVSIGPLHDENEFRRGQLLKLVRAKHFIKESSQCKQRLYNNILKEIESFKKCYDQQALLKKFQGTDEDLAWMFFVDGCALIDKVRFFLDKFGSRDVAVDEVCEVVTRDFMLLENQIPLGVLNMVMGFDKDGGQLYQNDHPVGKQSKEYRQSICQFSKFVAMINFQRSEIVGKVDDESFKKADHLLGLIWMNLVEKEKVDCPYNAMATSPGFCSVKDLQAAGIILEPNNSTSSLRDISFNRGIFFCKLKIPSFCVSKQGKFLVFNLIAFEMNSNFDKDLVVTSYISFLNSLVATKEDVVELRKAGILFNYLLNDEEVLKTFREFTSDLKPFCNIFADTRRQVMNYFNDKKSMTIGKWLSEAMYVYFKSPWTTITFVSATFLLILTIIQTIFSVLAYH